MEYKYIHFVKIEDKPKTSIYSCRNNKSNDELGIIKWYPGWRQYCFMPIGECVFSVGCLEDINNFINKITKVLKDKS